jgi:hypothetical protein
MSDSPQTPRDRLMRFAPRSSRVLAALLATAAVLAFVIAFALGRSSGDTVAPLRGATPLVPSSQAVEIRGLPAARSLPSLKPRAAAADGPKPVVITGEG